MKNMGIEIEYKFRVKSKKKLISDLGKLGKIKEERQYQSNVMFDNPQKLMTTTDGRIRVRTLGETGNKTFTYKKPLPSENGAKREIEYEVDVVDQNGNLENILRSMEFNPSTSYERYRTEWSVGNVSVTLDEYPHDTFIEIEGSKEDISSLAKELGFNVKIGLTKPADTLFQEWRKQKGLPFKPHIRFNDFNK